MVPICLGPVCQLKFMSFSHNMSVRKKITFPIILYYRGVPGLQMIVLAATGVVD